MNRVIDDLISRSVLIDELMAGCMPLDLPGLSGVTGDKLTIRNYIDNMPSVDAKPVVRGRWIKMTGMMPPEYHGHYECSECGWHMKGLRNSWTREEELSYCPNCGAKMETKNE